MYALDVFIDLYVLLWYIHFQSNKNILNNIYYMQYIHLYYTLNIETYSISGVILREFLQMLVKLTKHSAASYFNVSSYNINRKQSFNIY